MVLALLGTGVALATVIVTIDAQGANDGPAQKDLTRFTFDDAAPPGHLLVSFNHDETGFSGANTGDGCFLFDTNGTGGADYALCITIGGDPATLQSTRLFTCGDDSASKCTQPQTELSSFASTCTVAQTSTDPFPTGDAYPEDTTTSCDIVLADMGATAAPALLDVCSFPSAQPNSAFSDCIVHSGPTAVTLRTFAAHRTADGVLVRWRTGSEADVLGFNILRRSGATTVKVNTRLIVGANALAGHRYAFADRHAPLSRMTYWLQSVDRSGGARILGSALAR